MYIFNRFFASTNPSLQYFLKNRKALLSIDEVNRTFSFQDKRFETGNISFDDIHSIDFIESRVRNTGVYSFARYRYCKIILKNENELVITCLMVHDIEKTLEVLLRLKPTKELRTICFLY